MILKKKHWLVKDKHKKAWTNQQRNPKGKTKRKAKEKNCFGISLLVAIVWLLEDEFYFKYVEMCIWCILELKIGKIRLVNKG